MALLGNRPSMTLLFGQLDAFTCGQLLAMYEHRVFVQVRPPHQTTTSSSQAIFAYESILIVVTLSETTRASL
jgi:hypothetical protein